MSVDLIYAIRRGDEATVKSLLASGADPNFRLPAESDHGPYLDQVTPLMVAVATAKATPEIVRLLLKCGADPFAVSAGGVSSVWYASGGGTGYPVTEKDLDLLESDHTYRQWGAGDVSRLQLILDAGGNPNEYAHNGRSCVYEACSVGDPHRLRLFIDSGATVAPALPPAPLEIPFAEEMGLLKDDILSQQLKSPLFQMVPLFAASSAGCLECVKLIIAAGFPLDYTLSRENALNNVGSREVAEYLWELGLRPNSDTDGFSALENAIENEDLTILQFLLSKADTDKIQSTLLTACGARMNAETVRVILEFGADANMPDKNYGSPLHYTCWQSDGNGGREAEIVAGTIRILIQAGADPNLLSRGTRPIHEAAFGDEGSPTAIRELLRHGADINGLDQDGQTALIVAARWGQVECVEVLIEADADRNLRDKDGKTALDYANEYRNIWKKRRFKFFNRQLSKLFRAMGQDESDIFDRARTDAERVIQILTS